MLKNFFKITFRNLARNRVYSLISILGLALGISSCIFIAMYVSDELSYDLHHEKKDRIVRLTNILNFSGEMSTALTDLPSGPTILQEYPEVENYVRFRRAGGQAGMELSYDEKVINLQNTWFTDSTLFDVFTYDVIAGDPAEALTAPKSIVLTKTTAELFFGNEDALGKQMKANNSFLTVTAIIADPPSNSEIPINALISMNTLPQGFHDAFNQDWFRIGFYTFLLFKDKPNIADFEEKMVAFEEKYVQPWSEANQIEAGLVYHITPLADVHFDAGKDYDMPKGDMSYIYIFSLLAIFILIIASINYINLSLAQSSKRAKEVGVRKTLGAKRQQLTSNFIGESVVITVIAAVVALAVVELLLGTFNQVTGKAFEANIIFDPSNIMVLIGIIFVVGLLAGSYPALVLSSFQPARVLKGDIAKDGSVGGIRKVLILVQFLFSIFMITGTILINEQMDFVSSMNLGFDRENILSIAIPADTTVNKQVPVWVDELRNDSRVKAASMTSVPTGQTGELMFRIEQEGALTERTIRFLFVDDQFLDVLGLELLEGRNFSKDIATDNTQAFIINQNAAKAFGWADEPLGKRVQWGIEANNQAQNDGVVVGVVSDFHFLSLHNPMEPIVLCYTPQGSNTLSLRLAGGDYSSLLNDMESRWNTMAPKHPFQFTFMDEALGQNYLQEKAASEIFTYFAVIALLIASLGLFALVSFTIQGRIKEIGIRKVLGASVPQLAWVLMRDFFILLVIAFLVTLPVNYYLNQQWLESFAFDAPFNALNYIVSFAISALMALLTISYHIIRVAKTDPVNALRYE